MSTQMLWSRVAWRMIVNWLIAASFGILLHWVPPAPNDDHIALAVLATVLGLLAAGIFTAYSSLSIEDSPPNSEGFYNAIDAVVFCCMYMLLYLSFFCLYRIGIQRAVGIIGEILLHLSLGILLSAMHFVDVWDRAQWAVQKAHNNEFPESEEPAELSSDSNSDDG